MTTADLDAYSAAEHERFIAELAEFCRIPSISADPAHAGDVVASAHHLRDAALAAGFLTAEVLPTTGHPAVLAEHVADPSLPTVLVYGHHDVQPVDPLEAWTTPPFDPTVRDGRLWCRGAVDDKGQVWMHLKAVEAWLRVRGHLPVNIRLLVEGAEEIGSAHFDDLIDSHRARLSADVAVISDTAVFARDVPSLCTGLRGLVALEVTVEGPSLDLHSGYFGGTIVNPAHVLAGIVAALHDRTTGRVDIPGFYDSVREPTVEERSMVAARPFDAARLCADAGDVPDLDGEVGWSPLERMWMRPTLDVNGVYGGYSGPGTKTIIPGRAGAKISCRLVPDQEPTIIAGLVADRIRAMAPTGARVHVEVEPHSGRPVITSLDHPAVGAARRAMEHGFGAAPVVIRSGGSIPPVATFQHVLGLPPLMVGVGLPDDQIHAPNESFDLGQFSGGIRTIAALWSELGALGREGLRHR